MNELRDLYDVQTAFYAAEEHRYAEFQRDVAAAAVEAARDTAGWSSLVARRPHKPKVAGSSPAPATSVAASEFSSGVSREHADVATHIEFVEYWHLDTDGNVDEHYILPSPGSARGTMSARRPH